MKKAIRHISINYRFLRLFLYLFTGFWLLHSTLYSVKKIEFPKFLIFLNYFLVPWLLSSAFWSGVGAREWIKKHKKTSVTVIVAFAIEYVALMLAKAQVFFQGFVFMIALCFIMLWSSNKMLEWSKKNKKNKQISIALGVVWTLFCALLILHYKKSIFFKKNVTLDFVCFFLVPTLLFAMFWSLIQTKKWIKKHEKQSTAITLMWSIVYILMFSKGKSIF